MIPYITEGLPGIGGSMRTLPEDFRVEEIPAYEICGCGEHLFLEITKRQITTQAAVKELAEFLGADTKDIGYAGMKDRQAVTAQRLSLPAASWPEKLLNTSRENIVRLASAPGGEGAEADTASLFAPPDNLTFKVKILGLHNNKLRTGHLSGNRFTIRLRGVRSDWREKAEPIAEALRERGFANFYGPQRFGREGNNAEIGLKGLQTGKLFGPKWRKWLMISALQSQLFNEWLERRIADGLFGRALCGDVFGKLPQGGIFYSLDPEAEQKRLDSFEITPMGPIFGGKMFKAQEEALKRENEILEKYGIELSAFKALKADGSRRRARLKIEDLRISEAEGEPVFSFTLPAGSYASVLMGEFIKEDLSASESGEEETCE